MDNRSRDSAAKPTTTCGRFLPERFLPPLSKYLPFLRVRFAECLPFLHLVPGGFLRPEIRNGAAMIKTSA